MRLQPFLAVLLLLPASAPKPARGIDAAVADSRRALLRQASHARPQPQGRILVRQWHGQYSGEIAPRHLIIGSETQWKNIWAELQPATPAPRIDFSRQRAVAVFAGQKPTAGYIVKFGAPTRQGRRLIVPFCVQAPRGMAAEVLSQPWGVAIVAVTGRNVIAVDDCKPAAVAKLAAGAIAGRVTDQKNSPVPLVRVTAGRAPHGGKYSTETRRNGAYRLNRIQPGLYRVRFVNPGFQVVVFRGVKVPPGKTVRLNVRLRIKP